MLYQSKLRLIQRVPGPVYRRYFAKFDQFGLIWLVVRSVRIQSLVLWYFAGTPRPSISTTLPRSILIRYVLQKVIVRENRVFGYVHVNMYSTLNM